MRNNKEALKSLQGMLKVFSICWCVNLIYFTSALWLSSYFQHIGSWAAHPLHYMMVAGGVLKGVLSVALLITCISIHDAKAWK